MDKLSSLPSLIRGGDQPMRDLQPCGLHQDQNALRNAAANFWKANHTQQATLCLNIALHKLIQHLEILADDASTLKTIAKAIQQNQTRENQPCVTPPNGQQVCITPMPAILTNPLSSLQQYHDDDQALQHLNQSNCDESAPGVCDSEHIETSLVIAARRQWWNTSREAIRQLRARGVTISDETRRSLTTLRDESESLLAQLRQTRMDEATIRCAVMWAQGENDVHLNVKFAQRLDAPVWTTTSTLL